MAKQGQHKNDARDPRKSPGRNKPAKSVTITTGTYKKKETVAEQVAAHEDPYKEPQAAKHEWQLDSREQVTRAGSPRARKGDLTKQDEQRAYVPGGTRGPEREPRYPRFTEQPAGRQLPGEQHPEPWRQDLNPDALAGQNRGPATDVAEQSARTLYDYKDLHRRFSGLADDDLKQVPVLAPGMRLQQGATYFDLNDADRGPFTATGDIVAGPENRFVPKSQVDYQLWNRLVGVDEPARIGEAGG
jgi:hypothetical protein